MSVDDEDVVFEGNQLYTYLNEIGLKEFEVAKRNTTLTALSSEEGCCNSYVSSFKVLGACISSTWKWLTETWWLNVQSMNLDTFHFQIETILQSGLLFEEDIQLLGSLIPKVENTEKTWRVSPLLHVAVAGSVGSVSWWSYSIWGATILPITASGTVIVFTLWNWKKVHENNRRLCQHKTLLNVLQELFVILRKSTKLVQENELILRGFTLAKTGSAVSRLEDSKLPCMARRWQTLPGLRIAIAYATLETIDILKSATCNLIACCPLLGQLDNSNHYVAFLDAKALGLPECRAENEAELKLDTLKRLHHIFLLLQSEFLRRLALCFCPDLWRESSTTPVERAMIIVDCVITKCSELKSNLVREYKIFYSYGISEGQSQISIPNKKQEDWKYLDTYMAVHSAGLHLQAMLFRVRMLEELLESQEGDEPEEFSEELEIKITDILQELDACKSCCEEGITQLNKLRNSLTNTPRAPPNCIGNVTNSKVVQQIVVPVGYTDLDPKVEDEVFEAVNSLESHNVECDDFQFKLSKEELLKREMEKQFSKRMLQELKSVLVDKAQEWKEREAKAIENKQQRYEMLVVRDGKVINNSNTNGVSTINNISLKDSSIHSNTENEKLAKCTLSLNDDIFLPKQDLPDEITLHERVEPSVSKSLSIQSSPNNCYNEDNFDCCSQASDDSISYVESGSTTKKSKYVYDWQVSHTDETINLEENVPQLQFALNTANEAVAKFRSSNMIPISSTFSGLGKRSYSEEIIDE